MHPGKGFRPIRSEITRSLARDVLHLELNHLKSSRYKRKKEPWKSQNFMASDLESCIIHSVRDSPNPAFGRQPWNEVPLKVDICSLPSKVARARSQHKYA